MLPRAREIRAAIEGPLVEIAGSGQFDLAAGAEPARQIHFSTGDDRFFRIGSASRWANPEMSGANCASGADYTGSRITYLSLLKTNSYEIRCDSLDRIGAKCTNLWVWSSLYGSSPEFVTPRKS